MCCHRAPQDQLLLSAPKPARGLGDSWTASVDPLGYKTAYLYNGRDERATINGGIVASEVFA